MEELTFKGGSEIIRMRYDRATKSAYVATSQTNYREVKVPWKYLFDKGKEHFQEKVTDKFNDKNFRLSVVASMIQYGYKLIPNKNGA